MECFLQLIFLVIDCPRIKEEEFLNRGNDQSRKFRIVNLISPDNFIDKDES